jgi:hypothetical protein
MEDLVRQARESRIAEKAAEYVDAVLAVRHVMCSSGECARPTGVQFADENKRHIVNAAERAAANLRYTVREAQDSILHPFNNLRQQFFYHVEHFASLAQEENVALDISAKAIAHALVPFARTPRTAGRSVQSVGEMSPQRVVNVGLTAMESYHPGWGARIKEVLMYSPIFEAAEALVSTLQEHHERMNHFTVESMIVDEAMIRITEKQDAWRKAGKDVDTEKRAAVAAGDKDFGMLVQIEDAQKMLFHATTEILGTATELLELFYKHLYVWCELSRNVGWWNGAFSEQTSFALLEKNATELKETMYPPAHWAYATGLGPMVTQQMLAKHRRPADMARKAGHDHVKHVVEDHGVLSDHILGDDFSGTLNALEMSLSLGTSLETLLKEPKKALKKCLSEDASAADGWIKRLKTLERTIEILARDYEGDYAKGKD